MAAIKEKKEEKVAKKAVKKEKSLAVKNSDIAYKVLVEPWITEKSHAAMALNKYTFKVTENADKKKVCRAIEGIYGVDVSDITMVTVHPKKKNYGRFEGKKSGFKKATVTLKEGQKIEFFQGA